ncbi:polyphosphate kinase 1 [Rhodocytophaga rosea]|nr:polyphosphate kinase 1 [Rhodocytophaga rosea]
MHSPMTLVSRYFERDLSWLSFNYRVLMEAADTSLPLYDRIGFMAIYSSNLDEFFRVRVASIRSLLQLNKPKINRELAYEPAVLLQEIYAVVDKQQNEYGAILRNSILPGLRENGIIIYQNEPLTEAHQQEVKHYFRSKVLSYVQPVLLNEAGARKPFLENRAIYFIVKLRLKNTQDGEQVKYAHLNIPSDQLPRFVELSKTAGKHYFIFLDDIVRLNLGSVFPGYEVLEAYSIKLNRDAELNIIDEFDGDLKDKIKNQLSQRELGPPARFLYDATMPEDTLEFLLETFELSKEDLFPGGRYHNLYDLMKLPNPITPDLQSAPLVPLLHPKLESVESVLEAMETQDYLLHFPYHSYDYILRFFNEAAIDPLVEEIKITLYRIAANSFIANALISAARNGKKVTVFVEVKARFDEENNLRWAEKMKKAGIDIIYSLPALKVHAKIALIHRKTADGQIQRYAYLGTGNFNENTARIYTDHGLLTCHRKMTKEMEAVFAYLCGDKQKRHFKHLLVSQFNLQECFLEMIDREIKQAKAGDKASIIIKLNNLEDEKMIDKLYEASQAGVQVELIIRGICCLIPQVEGLSENIQVTRLVDRFLEHARVFIFYNGGDTEVYLASADWMKRNLYRRIEVGFPVYDEIMKAELMEIIRFQLQDNTKAVWLDTHQHNMSIKSATNETRIRAQMDTYQWLKQKQESFYKPEKMDSENHLKNPLSSL